MIKPTRAEVSFMVGGALMLAYGMSWLYAILHQVCQR